MPRHVRTHNDSIQGRQAHDSAKRKTSCLASFPLYGAVNGSFKRQWADHSKTVTTIFQRTSVSMVVVSGILFFAGRAFVNYAPHDEARFDNTPGTSLAGSYKDIGSNGSIKPHPEPSYKMSQEPQSSNDGAIILGEPVAMPDLKTGTIKKTPPSRTDPASDPAGKRK